MKCCFSVINVMTTGRITFSLFAAFFFALSSSLASAQSFETLVMPGKLTEAHAKIEKECTKCHAPFKKAEQSKLCLDCHKPVAEDVAAKRGFHGLSPAVQGKECKSCHADHKGREAKIAAFDSSKFNHSHTDFVLRNAHQNLECKSCHRAQDKYRDAASTCIACHRKDDKHKGSLGEKCESCHSDKTWKDAKFDHEKTRFSLSGKHADAKCDTCHVNNNYKDTPRTCIACHRKDDAHKGRYGEKCETCHNADNWKSQFSHAKQTRFALLGKHASTKCDSCHTKPLYSEKPPIKCVACHTKDDVHKGSLGEKCESCHKETGWSATNFDHNRDTHFSLFNKHKTAVCSACHKNGLKEKLPTECDSCHKKDDSHKGNFGRSCETCHNDKGWKPSTFDHAKSTRYPLKQAHAQLKCDGCHTGILYVKSGGKALATECYSCHRKDDAHKGQLGERCDSCHNETKWTGVPYDHSQSRFKLTGLHAHTQCRACHKTPAFKDAPIACAKCHVGDDVHKNTLGSKCDLCHNTRSWTAWDFNHTKQTSFLLDGAHEKLSCGKCHKQPARADSASIADISRTCFGCHSGDDIHSGGFGQQCERCHVTRDWRTLNPGITRGNAKVLPPK
jgi:hypothetical protein